MALGQTVFPPLWGAQSFNWGAGMHRINTAASFIKYNMPLGKPGTLSDRDAWDVAAFMNSHERPQDPRLVDGSVEKTRQKFHANDGVNLYGQKVNGVLLGQGNLTLVAWRPQDGDPVRRKQVGAGVGRITPTALSADA